MLTLWVLFLLVGALGGFTAGLFGVGGGLVIVPTLYWLWKSDPILGHEVMHYAVATSLACIVVTSVTSSWTHWRAGRFQFEPLPGLALAVSLGSVSAILFANWLPSEWLKQGFGLFALLVGLSLVFKSTSQAQEPNLRITELVGVGTIIGHVSTLLGVSGGALTVPYLMHRGVGMREAVVVSSAVALPISLIGASGLALTGADTPETWGYVHWPAFLGISLVSGFFSKRGAELSQTMDKSWLQRLFSVFLGLVAWHMLSF